MMEHKKNLPRRAIVMDNGSGFTKVGFSGENSPQYVIPTAIGYDFHKIDALKFNNDSEFEIRDDNIFPENQLKLPKPMEKGRIINWDTMEYLWDSTFKNLLHVDSSENPLILTEISLTPYSVREKIAEIMFETFNIPALCIENQAKLSLYASGRTTGFVIDLGYDSTKLVAIEKGFELTHQTQIMGIGGKDITDYLTRLFRVKGYKFEKIGGRETVRKIKEDNCYISIDPEKEFKASRDKSGKKFPYTLPNGNVFNLGVDRFMAPECLFNPSILGKEIESLDEKISRVIRNFDVDISKDMCRNIILSGGTSMFQGLKERLTKGIEDRIWPNTVVKVITPRDRKYSSWIGGSNLLSSNNFNDKWISKREYKEEGPEIVRRL